MGSAPETASVEELLAQSLKRNRETLASVSAEIHSHPELAYQEFRAHDTLCDTLTTLGYNVTRHAYNIKTAFEAEFGQGGAVVAYNAEYDALPGIGHACGHNLIATSSLAAFLATAEVLAETGRPGRVRLIGTPAEEDGGGKVDLIRAGAYKDVDACLMGHPGPTNGGWNNIILPRLMARSSVKVTFKGKSAHAGNAPWQGLNALDAAVASYTSISMLRQQTPPNQRIHAIISKGGERPNIIPYLTEISLYVRAETDVELQKTLRRIVECCEGGAKAAGCELSFEWANSYKELECSETIADVFSEKASSTGQEYGRELPSVSGASTDQGS
ncbi:amidohydrolase [Sarocladium strictum]